ncbi:MAG: ribosome silencing factor [Porticoccus sp.]|nr:ribosome silencing factor [Porticoccus sp.]PCJ93755.1 MAG: ribosome silencing factor [Porticoccaceae bacterium]
MSKKLIDIVMNALEEVKGKDIATLDVSDMTDVMDTIIVASGSSNRQVKALANNVIEDCKKAGFQPIGVEGMDTSEWVLVDLGDIVVHLMQPATREFYDLEKLWSVRPSDRDTFNDGEA